MLTVERNPAGFAAEYLRCLNACFPHWGDERVYRWGLERPMSGLKPDQMVLRVDGRVAAGSAVSYRTVGLPDGRHVLAGIMTGSWTLPEARGQGCFARVIAESVELAAQRGSAALLAFVTEDNPSCRQLQKAGSALIPTFYLVSNDRTPRPEHASEIEPETAGESRLEEIARCFQARRSSRNRFSYLSPQEFRTQFHDRPAGTTLYRTVDGHLGLVEKGADTDRLQFLLPSGATPAHLEAALAGFLRHSLQQSRRLFLFSMRETVRDTALSLGMQVKNGYLTMLPADPGAWSEVRELMTASSWDLESGDRI